MRALSRTVLVLSLAALAVRDAEGQTVDAGRGPVPVHVPPSYHPDVPTPVVIALHGYMSSGPAIEGYFQLTPLADQMGFLYLAPNGMLDLLNRRFWNATNACCDLFGTGVNDSGYLRALIEAVRAAFNVDDRRVFLIGHSNGGFMAYRMACDHADAIAGIASLAGATWANPALCNPTEPVPVLQIHGTSDSVINYNGGSVLAPYPGAVTTVQTWATYDGCLLVADTSPGPLDLEAAIPGAESNVQRYEMACQPGGAAELWTIPGGAHSPALSAQFGQLVLEHLFARPKPGAVTRFCSGKTSSTGCVPFVTWNGSASVSSTAPFQVRAIDAVPNESGLLLYSFKKANLDFHGGKLCVKAPVVRTGAKAAKSVGGGCSGWTLTRDVNAVIQSGNDPMLTAGASIAVQWRQRDPADPAGFGDALTDGVHFAITP